MSNPITTTFASEKVRDGRWAVHCDGTVVQVQSESEAELLASLPAEHAKIGTGPGPERDRVRRILAICNRYDLYKMFAVRQLDHWFRNSSPPNGRSAGAE